MKFLPLIAVLIIVLLPELASAQGFIPCEGANVNGLTACTECHFVQMGNTILKWLIGVLFVVFAVVLVMGGFGLVTSGGNPAAKNEAKSKLVNALIGIIIVLAAWLIVDTVMRGLLTGGTGEISGYGPWSEVECGSQAVSFAREGGAAIDEAQTVVPAPSTAVAAGSMTQSAAEALLAGKSITVVSSGSCTDKTKTNCTSLDGIKENTLNGLISLQSAVGVPFVITGGTEAGHSEGTYSHSNGYKVDVRPNEALNTYITTNFTQIGATKYQDSKGNTYYRHPPDHWDITITN